MTGHIKQTTTTLLVLEALQNADDFLTAREIMRITGRESNRVTAALAHLRKHKVVECLEQDGQLFWYLTGEDDRETTREEIVAGYVKPNRRSRRIIKESMS